MKTLIIITSAMLLFFTAKGQVDTSFNKIKRDIDSILINSLESEFSEKGNINVLVFQDMRKAIYNISYSSISGLSIIKEKETIDSVIYKRESLRKKNSIFYHALDLSYLSYFNSENILIEDKSVYFTYSVLIQLPLENWGIAEDFFYNSKFNFQNAIGKDSVSITIPVYVYKNKQLKKSYHYKLTLLKNKRNIIPKISEIYQVQYVKVK